MPGRIIDLIIELKGKCSLKEEQIRNEFHLSQAEYRGILSLNRGEKVTCSDFAKRMDLSPSRGSRVIERLNNKGVLLSQPVSGDRRALLLSLTKKGLRVQSRIDERKNGCEQTMLSKCSIPEVKALKSNLELLVTILE